MRTMSYATSQARYAEILDGVVTDDEEIIITRDGHEPAVIVSLAKYEALHATMGLRLSSTEGKHLRTSIECVEERQGEVLEPFE